MDEPEHTGQISIRTWRNRCARVRRVGIVYGDIGTSPLYAFREAFERARTSRSTRPDASRRRCRSSFWALIIVISIKYLMLVMRADNHGEGGILALTALVMPPRRRRDGASAAVVTLGMFGTALLYGDGMITPAISVLSAVEGFEVATHGLRARS